MIVDELRPIVSEFIAEMLNDPCCESILLDVGEDAMVDSDLPVFYLDIVGKRYGCTLSIVGAECSASIRNCGTDETITTVKGRGMGASGSARRNQDKTTGGELIKMFDWEFLKHVTEACKNYASGGGNDSLGLEVSAWNNSIHIVVASSGHRFVFEADSVRGYKVTIFEQTNRYWGPMFGVGYTFDGDEILDAFNGFFAHVEVENN